MFDGKFAEATPLFREAVTLVPEPKYFFNLGTSLFQEGRFDEALTALYAIQYNNPTPEQLLKTDTLRAKILDECKAQGMRCGLTPAVEEAVRRLARERQTRDATATVGSTSSAPPKREKQDDKVASAAALNENGKTVLYAGKWAEAEASFRKAFEVDAQPQYLFNLALVLFQQDQFAQALTELDRLRALDLPPALRKREEELARRAVDGCKTHKLPCAQRP
jgi:tetratricopeptide (TPR) repeat protein